MQEFVQALGERLSEPLQMAPEEAVLLMHSICRLFHGDELADRLGTEANWTATMLPGLIARNRAQRLRERFDPEVRREKIAQTLLAFDQADGTLEGDTAYQENLAPAAG